MLRESRVEQGLQDLKHGLLDKTVEHARDAELPHPAASLGNSHPLHGLGLVAARKKRLAKTRPVHP